ncbi:MAG: ABC transporter ATP-binding protein [Planctomycetes bacterium]|nr:ABC transporter ATP-binding protein [Planctomycetota bacterium]
MTAIRASNLWRFYDGAPAVRGLDLAVERGSAYGFIGPNGAGKSTTLRMLATLDRPDAGRVWLEGRDVQRDLRGARRRLGFMPDPFALYDELTVEDHLLLFAQTYGLPPSARRRAVDRAIELTRTQEVRARRCGALSKGWRQRALLARTLVHDPPVLLLDEPASGLDPAARIEFREVVRALRELGKAIVVSSHILTELSDFCDSVGIIQQGRMLVSGRIDDILRRLDPNEQVQLDLPGDAAPARALLAAHPEVLEVRDGLGAPPGTARLLAVLRGRATPEVRAALVRALVEGGCAPCGVSATREGLEDLFLRVSAGSRGQDVRGASALRQVLDGDGGADREGAPPAGAAR